MKHLLAYSVYQDLDRLFPALSEKLSEIRCDGLEVLTDHAVPDAIYEQYTETVHLPYAVDWISAWEERPYDLPDDLSKYYMFGRCRSEVIGTVSEMIVNASRLKPMQGVIHATNVEFPKLISRTHAQSSRYVLETFCEMMNSVVSAMPGSEPPFKLMFENLWWPGLRMLDNGDFEILDRKIEFENWGICLDTGHLMNCIPDIESEQAGIDALLGIFDTYSQDLKDAVGEMHFHYSASGKYRREFEESEYEGGPIEDFIATAYPHISTLDQHRPFSDSRCKELVDIIQPDVVVHELPGYNGSPLDDFVQQRNLLD